MVCNLSCLSWVIDVVVEINVRSVLQALLLFKGDLRPEELCRCRSRAERLRFSSLSGAALLLGWGNSLAANSCI